MGILARALLFISVAACGAVRGMPQSGKVGLTVAADHTEGPILIHGFGDHAESPILIHEVKEHTDPVHAKGLRPTHNALANGDKLLFTHRYQHHDPVSDQLTYFQYHARRHDHVVVLTQNEVRSCTAVPTSSDNFTSLTLDLASNMSDYNLTMGTIIVSDRLGCVTKDGPWRKLLRERVVTEPAAAEQAGSDSDAIKVTLLTSPAAFHECFEHAHIEYFQGSPHKLGDARDARKRSLTSSGFDVPLDGFASTEAVLTEASANSQSAADLDAPMTSGSVAARLARGDTELQGVASTPNNASLDRRKLAHSSCMFGADNDIAITLYGTDCTSFATGSAMDDDRCFWRPNANGMIGLKAGNTYTLRWRSSTASNANAEIFIQESNGGWGSTHCADLSPTLWIPNQVWTGSTGSSPNSFTFTMPDLRAMSCANDFLGGFPEFRFRVRTQGDCHRGTWGLFRLLEARDVSGSLSLQVPSNYVIGTESAGLQVECTNCGVTGTGDIHVLARTSNYNPFDETWTWGNLALIGSVDVQAQAHLTGSRSLSPIEVLGRTCLPGLCVGAQVASVDIFMGIFGELWLAADASFDASATLSYTRSLQTSGSVQYHTRGGSEVSHDITGFQPSAGSDATSTPTLRVNIDAAARVYVVPRLYAGLFLSLATYSSMEAYVKAEVHLGLQARFNFRTAYGASNYLRSIGSDSQCTSALMGCTAQCSQNHDTRLGFDMFVDLFAAYKLYIHANLPVFGSVSVGSSSEVNFSPAPFISLTIPIGSFCWYLFPPSPSPPPSPPAALPSADTSTGTVGLCSNTCSLANDGDCDDGGIGSEFAVCTSGTDCTDCSMRTPPPTDSGTTSNRPEVTISFTASGDVTDYDEGKKNGIAQVIADAVGVEQSEVTITIAVGSVIVTAVIATTTMDASSTVSTLSNGICASPSALTTALIDGGISGVNVGEITAVSSSTRMTSSPVATTNNSIVVPVIAGAAAFVVLSLGVGVLICLRRRSKRTSANASGTELDATASGTHLPNVSTNSVTAYTSTCASSASTAKHEDEVTTKVDPSAGSVALTPSAPTTSSAPTPSAPPPSQPETSQPKPQIINVTIQQQQAAPQPVMMMQPQPMMVQQPMYPGQPMMVQQPVTYQQPMMTPQSQPVMYQQPQ